MDNELISQGVNLMLMGMGVVFVFLTLLVFATSAMSRVVQQYFPQPLPTAPTGSPPVRPESSQPDPRTLAVIKAAIAEHRNKRASQ